MNIYSDNMTARPKIIEKLSQILQNPHHYKFHHVNGENTGS